MSAKVTRRYIWIFLGITLVFFVFATQFSLNQRVSEGKNARRTVEIGGKTINVTLADTPASREQGLSGTKGLASDEGMLFIFPRDGKYSFWMKDMLYAIDIVWISSDGKVVYIVPNASPESYPATFTSKMLARYVLELRANFVKTNNVKIGDIVRL